MREDMKKPTLRGSVRKEQQRKEIGATSEIKGGRTVDAKHPPRENLRHEAKVSPHPIITGGTYPLSKQSIMCSLNETDFKRADDLGRGP